MKLLFLLFHKLLAVLVVFLVPSRDCLSNTAYSLFNRSSSVWRPSWAMIFFTFCSLLSYQNKTLRLVNEVSKQVMRGRWSEPSKQRYQLWPEGKISSHLWFDRARSKRQCLSDHIATLSGIGSYQSNRDHRDHIKTWKYGSRQKTPRIWYFPLISLSCLKFHWNPP